MNIGLREKFLFPILLLILAGTLATAFVSFINSKNMIEKSIRGQLRQNARSTLDYIVSWVDNRKQDVKLWAEQPNLAIAIATVSADGQGSNLFMQEVNASLRKYREAHPYFEEIGVTYDDGTIITSSAEKRVDSSLGKRGSRSVRETDFFTHSRRGDVYISGVRSSEKTGSPVCVISAPVFGAGNDGAQKVAGVLYAVVDLLYFAEKFVNPITIGQSGYVFIFDSSGMVISHPDSAKIMRMNLMSTEYGQRMIQQGDGIIEYRTGSRDSMAAFKTERDLGWTIAAAASVDELLAPVWQLARINIIMTVGILLVALAVIIFASARVSRPITSATESLNLVAEQVSFAADQISASSQQLAQGASSQASSIEETSASLEQLSAMGSRNADNALEANRLSRDMRTDATEGAATMDRLVAAMSAITESSNEVAQIAKVLEEIAFQTNILSLNAAVEAARAGDAGRGFAVVAEEVRNLAQRASEQARITGDLITESRGRTEEGSKQARDAHESLKSIVVSVDTVARLVSEISAACREQAQGIAQINHAVSDMDQVVQQNSASSEQSAAASEELSSQAFHMRSLAAKLRLQVSGRDDGLVRGRRNKTVTAGRFAAQAIAQSPQRVRPEDVIPFDDEDEELKRF